MQSQSSDLAMRPDYEFQTALTATTNDTTRVLGHIGQSIAGGY